MTRTLEVLTSGTRTGRLAQALGMMSDSLSALRGSSRRGERDSSEREGVSVEQVEYNTIYYMDTLLLT